MPKIKILFLLIVPVFIFSIKISAQNITPSPDANGLFTLPNIDTWIFHSSVIGEDYEIYVLRTAAYDSGKIKLPVLYMTDGDWNMTVAMNCFSMLRQDYNTREPLIVGIGYGKGKNKRMRDLDPQTGGQKFLTFIEKEVIPFINEKYRTEKEKGIYGYSMGGMFTTYILFNRPELFDEVFIGAPGNNGRLLMPAVRQYFKTHKDLKSKVFAGVGSFEHETALNIDSFKNYLIGKNCASLQFKTDITPGAGHGAALAAVMQNAIAFAYCEKHKAVSVITNVLEQLAGEYVCDDKSVPNALIIFKNDKLYWKLKPQEDPATELLAASENDYFMVENERISFSFKKENGKQKMIITPEDNKKFQFIKND